MMTMLDKSAILAAQDLKTQDVEVPEWGGSVRIKTLSGREREEFMGSVSTTDETMEANLRMGMLMRRLLVMTMVGEDGGRLFTDDDVDALGSKSPEALGRVFTVAQQLNGLGSKARDDIAKN